MLRIQQKLKMDEYADVDELKADFLKLFNNALAYYKKGSPEHRDAMEMSELFHKALGKIDRSFLVNTHVISVAVPLLSTFYCFRTFRYLYLPFLGI